MRSSLDGASRLSSRSINSLLAAAACVGTLAASPASAAPADPPASGTTIAAAAAAEAALATANAETTAAGQAPSGADAVLEFFRSVEFSGIIDAYYNYNFNEPPTASFPENATGVLTRNFDVRHNQFSLGLVEFAANRPATADDQIGFRFDLQYGQVAQIFNGDPVDNNALVNVQQGYVSYYAPVGNGLTFDFGKFVTPIGTEPTEAKDNFNYSRAFLYALGPYYHVGGRIGYTVSDKVSLTGLIVNGWNATGDNNSGKTVGGGITIKPNAKFTFIQNALFGPEQTDNADDSRTYLDSNVAYALNDTNALGLNYIWADDGVGGEDIGWQGLALYYRNQVTDRFAFAPRFEWYNDSDGFVTGVAQTMKEFTLTGELKHSKGLIFRAEYRSDWSDEDFFIKNGDFVSSQNTFTFAFIYSFSSKAP